MSTLASDEVAADYKDGLEDLHTNDKTQINILTVIARESIEHAEAIARTLMNHIKKVSIGDHVLTSLINLCRHPQLGNYQHSTYSTQL